MKNKLLLENTIINLDHIERLEKKGKSLIFYMASGAVFNCSFEDEKLTDDIFCKVLSFVEASVEPMKSAVKRKWFT